MSTTDAARRCAEDVQLNWHQDGSVELEQRIARHMADLLASETAELRAENERLRDRLSEVHYKE